MVILALGEEGAKPYMEVNKTHYTKLLEMYRRGKAASAQGEVDYTEFHTHLWCLLTRCVCPRNNSAMYFMPLCPLQ